MTTDFKEVPVIDISGLRSLNLSDRKQVAEEIGKAAEQVGFFYIRNHDVTQETIDGVKEAAADFFAHPLEYKMKYYIGNSFCHRGYVPEGEEVFDEAARPDRKEAIDFGRDLQEDHPLVKARLPFHGPNQWPEGILNFQTKVRNYYNSVFNLSKTLIEGFTLALGMDEATFGKEFNEQLAAFRLIHYPYDEDSSENSANPNNKQSPSQGIGEHTDYECFTILYSDTPGLEVVNSKNKWIKVPPIPRTFVINIGDTLEIMTNRRFTATAHRVRNVPRERYSFPMFVGCNYHTRVAPLPQFASTSERFASKYGEVVSGDQIWASVMQTHRYLLDKVARGELKYPENTTQRGTYGPDAILKF